MKCPYCNSKVLLKDSSIIYGRSYGMVYICENYPKCKSYVGVHKGTNIPLGTIANESLRELRKKCHLSFDKLWKNYKYSRKQAYKMLQNMMNLTKEKTHIAMFNENQCKYLLEQLKENQ